MVRKNEIKIGIIFSYALIFANIIYGLLITPYILNNVGESSYGVFKSISSISASLAVMDFGLGSTLTRYMAHYHASGEKQKARNFAAMTFIQFAILAIAILIVGSIAFLFLNPIYNESFSNDEIRLAKEIYGFLIANMVLRLLEDLFFGIASGYEHFKVANGVKLFSLLLKIASIWILLPLFGSIMVVVVSEMVITTIGILFFAIYNSKVIGIIPKLTKWDSVVFKESMGYTTLMFVQTITTQFNGNVDNILIGAKIGAVSVTIYSMALHIFSMYENLSGSIANIMLPNMTKRVFLNQLPEELQAGVEKAGRFQFMLLAAALGGFIVLGKDFYYLWIGDAFSDCYYLTLILIIPITFTMVQNVCLSILRAQNKMGYRTITLVVSCLINVITTIIGINICGYWGAAIGTAIATVSNLIFMNVYYVRELKFNVIIMFGRIFNRTVVCAIIATSLTFGLHVFLNRTWLSFIVNAIVFMSVYIALMIVWGLSSNEKTYLFGRFVGKKDKKSE